MITSILAISKERGITEHNCTDSRTEVFCLEMGEGSWVIFASILAKCKGGVTKHNRTDTRTEVFCLEMREGVIFASILAICKGGGLQSIIALILALKYFVWR